MNEPRLGIGFHQLGSGFKINHTEGIVDVAKSDSLPWHNITTTYGPLVQWRRGMTDLKVKISGRFTSALANSDVLVTLPPEAVVGIPITYIQASKYTSLVNASAATRLLILESDGRIRNTTGLSYGTGQYLFADHSVIYN